MFRFLRINTDAVWENPIVAKRFHRYLGVLTGKKISKYQIAKKTPVPTTSLKNLALDNLWKYHKETRSEFNDLMKKLDSNELHIENLSSPEISFLDLKVHIAHEILKSCHLCERNCNINRVSGKYGFCRLDERSVVTSVFLHIGEEPPLIPSGTIFYAGCVFKCVFCQNWSISQKWGSLKHLNEGYFVTPASLSKLMNNLADEGAKNINWVGGDPTPNIHTILAALTYFNRNIIQLWNSNMYLTLEAMELLLDIIDFWLPDLKFRENEFAQKMTGVGNYWEIVTRNIKLAYDRSSSEMIIRHLVMPARVKGDTLPILNWCAQNVERAFVNIMDQYRPEHKVLGNPHYQLINRRTSTREMSQARDCADQLGIRWREVS